MAKVETIRLRSLQTQVGATRWARHITLDYLQSTRVGSLMASKSVVGERPAFLYLHQVYGTAVTTSSILTFTQRPLDPRSGKGRKIW
jgi:hypothetical protein